MNAAHLAARLRRLAVLRAEAELARQCAAEAAAMRAEAEAAAAIGREIASDHPEPGADAFATWLAAARLGHDRARTRRAEAAQSVLDARTRLACAETAQAAIDSLIERRARAAGVRAMRAAQIAIDDRAGRTRRAEAWRSAPRVGPGG